MKKKAATQNRRIFAALLVMLITLFGVIVQSPAANAETGDYPYASYSGPGTNPTKSWWTNSSGGGYSNYGYVYRNCTDYVAWKLQSLGIADSKTRGLGNGGQWATNASGRSGVTVNTTPAYGAVAVNPNIGEYGHVAFVESVNTNGTITVSEYNYTAPPTGNYGTRTGVPSELGFTKFVHFGVTSVAPPTSVIPNDIHWWQGNTVYAFVGPNFNTTSSSSGYIPGDWHGVMDYNNDGRDDIVLYRASDQSLRVLLKNSGPGYTGHPNNPIRTGVGAPTWAGVSNISN